MNIVLEVKGNRAVLLDDNGKMHIVRNKNYSVGQSVAYSSANMIYRACAAAACIIALLSGSAAGCHSYFTAAAYLSVDINPSIQLEINRFERVIEVEAFNDEGSLILNGVKLKNGSVNTAIEKIIDAAKENGYLTEGDNGVILDVASDSTDIINDISGIAGEYADKMINVIVEQATSEDVEMSKSLNVSIGRVKTLREYTEIFGGNIEENQETLKESSVKELREKNKQKTEEENNKGTDDNKNDVIAVENSSTVKAEEKAAPKAETEKQAATEQKSAEKSGKEAEKQAEAAEKQDEQAEREAERKEEEAEKEAERREEEAEKEAERREEEAEKEAERREEEAEKEAERREKEAEKQREEIEKQAEKSDKDDD